MPPGRGLLSYQRIHRIDHTEPGAIAAASVLAIWGKSADVCLQPRGDHMNIDYQSLFDEYLEILTTGVRKKSPSILRVLSEWDRIVFPNAEASYVDPQRKRRGKSDGYHRAMEAMMKEQPAEDESHHSGAEGPIGDNNEGNRGRGVTETREESSDASER
ncbi:hypothetical protein DFH09DRAFT_1327491 [Mycena vulgaris]|nr:hypothetical protein DFH09DRAFT_1327491 [Mycena vulgaris]